MKRVWFFVITVLAIVSLISLRGITGYTTAEIPESDSAFANIGVSAIGLIIVAFLFVMYKKEKIAVKKKKSDAVWNELERAEDEWLKRK